MQRKHPLPEPTFYTLKTLANKWECDEEQVINYMLTGQLKTSVISNGWWLESGTFEKTDDGYSKRVCRSVDLSSGHPLTLYPKSVKKILTNGEIINPTFESKPGTYLCASFRHYPRHIRYYSRDEKQFILEKHDLVFTPGHIAAFEKSEAGEKSADYNGKNHNFPDRPKLLDQLKPEMYDDAMPLWEDFITEHGKEPTRKDTVRLLRETYPEKYGQHEESSIERCLKLKSLAIAYSRYKSKKG